MDCGIYCIENVKTGECYVGQTRRKFRIRKPEHFTDLENGLHTSDVLQKSFNKHGKSTFRFKVLHRGDRNLDKLEADYILKLNAACNESWPGTGYRIQRDDKGRIIPLKKEQRSGKSSSDDWAWWWGSMIGAIAGLLIFHLSQ
jgi:group I intron endonuclease